MPPSRESENRSAKRKQRERQNYKEKEKRNRVLKSTRLYLRRPRGSRESSAGWLAEKFYGKAVSMVSAALKLCRPNLANLALAFRRSPVTRSLFLAAGWCRLPSFASCHQVYFHSTIPVPTTITLCLLSSFWVLYDHLSIALPCSCIESGCSGSLMFALRT